MFITQLLGVPNMNQVIFFFPAYGTIAHEKGVGLCAYYSPIKTEEEKAAEEAAEAAKKEEKVFFCKCVIF